MQKIFEKIYFYFKISFSKLSTALALSCKRVCNILNKSLLYSLFPPNIHLQYYSYQRFLQHVAFFSSKFAFFFPIFTLNTVSARDFCNMLHFSLLNSPRSTKAPPKTQKPPEQGKPASRAFMLNFILLSVPGRTSSDNGTGLHG